MAQVSNAEAIQPAVLSGDVETFARCVSAYWSQKKLMAGDGVEPTLITRALAAMSPHLEVRRPLLKLADFERSDVGDVGVCEQGYTLAGAGGGGFILLVTKKPNDRPHPAFPDCPQGPENG